MKSGTGSGYDLKATAGLMLWLAGIMASGYLSAQENFIVIITGMLLAFGGYSMMYNREMSAGTWWVAGMGARILLIPVFPAWSDDVYRFFWDGSLTLAGYNPYGMLPADAIQAGVEVLTPQLFEKLNSQGYYTVYPPVGQLYFASASLAGDVENFAIWLRCLMIVTEGIIYGYLVFNRGVGPLSTKWLWLFFLNPLVIIEGTGNLHFEAVMISFLALSIHFYFRGKIRSSVAFLAISIGCKLLPAMLIPWFLFRTKGRNRITLLATLTGVTLAIFIPLWMDGALVSMLRSTDLYFRKFEFNAGIYFILREVGTYMTGYNLIQYLGPLLGVTALAINLLAAKKNVENSERSFFLYALTAWTAYLLLSTTVHPWYIISLVFLGAAAGRVYPLLWSFLAVLSYAHYSADFGRYESLFLWIEYITVLGLMAYEYQKAGHTTHPLQS